MTDTNTMNDTVNPENFWEKYYTFEALSKKKAFKKLRIKWGLSLSGIIIKRLAISYVVIPGALLFFYFLLAWHSEGLASTLNVIFIGHTENITVTGASAVEKTWHLVGLLAFGFLWLVDGWDSPVNKRVRKEMEIWWHKHSPHLPNT